MANRINMARESNAELLRLICMFFIVFHHILVHGAYPELLEGGAAIASTDAKIALFLNGLFFPAVNIFILISGYFGISVSVKKFFHLYTFCGFYGMLDFLGRMAFLDVPFGRAFFSATFLPFTHNCYWFIPCYFVLFLLSPIFNKFIRETSKRDYVIVLGLLSIVTLYVGFFWRRGDNPNGYTSIQLAYMYFIGGGIKRFFDFRKNFKYRYCFLSCYLISAVCWTVMGLIQQHWVPFCYNNPFIITGAIGFFGFVMTFNFKSKPVNWLASSALAVYLIQSSHTGELLYRAIKYFMANISCGRWGNFLTFSALALSITIFCCLFDKIRVLIMKPIWIIYGKIEQKRRLCQPQ